MMTYRLVFVLFMLALSFASNGCSREKSAASLLETAQFEEKQHNREHAEQLYREIVAKFPDSPAAATASKRLGELQRQTP